MIGKKRKKNDMENNNNNNSGSNFFSGFILGALVGAAVVFLLGTKKGKKLLKVISEEKLDKISNLLEESDKSVSFQDEELEENVEKPAFVQTASFRQKPIYEKPKVRRFFRGISRRVN